MKLGGDIPFTLTTKKALEYAIDFARHFHHNYIGTEHVLLGIVHERRNLAARILREYGVTEERLKRRTLELLRAAEEKHEKEKEFKVLLSHDPTHWEDHVKSYNKHIHLTLSGHTHGFQMGIDLPMFKWSPIKYVYKHWAGLYQEAGKFLYVNRGFGFLGFAGRVGVFPEITVFELTKK